MKIGAMDINLIISVIKLTFAILLPICRITWGEIMSSGWAPLPQILHEDVGEVTMTFYAPQNVTFCHISTNDGNALEETGDYKGISETKYFNITTRSVDVVLSILNDDVCEPTESFQLLADCDQGYSFDANITIVANDPPNFLLPSDVSVLGGNDAVLVLIVEPPTGGFEGVLSCHVKTVDKTAVAPDDYHSFDKIITFPASTLADETDIEIPTRKVFGERLSKYFEVIVSCSFDITLKSTVTIEKSSEENATSNPHSGQLVINSETGNTFLICYDASGQEGDYIVLYKDSLCDLKVIGRHIDRYYMGAIFFKSPKANVSLSLEGITLGSSAVKEWSNSSSWSSVIGSISISVINHLARIRIDVKGRSLLFEVIKTQLDSNNHLDFYIISINNESFLDNYAGGLIGTISHNKFALLTDDSIEENHEWSAIRVNGRIGSAKKSLIFGYDCWFLNLEHILYPRKLKEFIWQTENMDLIQ
ncbi:DgyrCDS6856 [Dimorphilus gyrociliatus]|uniref:DgyrCDS6856 n=1 Tax=Dimorphilus gyrociliatus TaxID=2664684 RepID=A0A7I8VPW2_9ANNE|nr:DgyrCDS6856 [Dimorphilus gyrociliatus]